MEQLPLCLEFIMGNCENKINCPKGHVEIEDKKAFLSQNLKKEELFDKIKLMIINETKIFSSEIKNKNEVIGFILKCSNCNKGYNLFKEKFDVDDIYFHLCTVCKKKDLKDIYL